MKTFAYCARSFADSVRRAANALPVTCPPMSLEGFSPSLLEGYDLLYFKLHGMEGQPFWYGDDWVTALSAEAIRQANLSGAVVFAANCHLAESPMLAALLAAGARAVVGGQGENYALRGGVAGADVLGRMFRRVLAWGGDVDHAYRLGLQVVRNALAMREIALEILPFHPGGLQARVDALRDTLGFQLYVRSEGDDGG